MSKHKGDIEIGQRAYEEVIRVYGGTSKAARAMMLDRRIFNSWKNDGVTPGGHVLALMHYHGCDVLYILTGKRYKT